MEAHGDKQSRSHQGTLETIHSCCCLSIRKGTTWVMYESWSWCTHGNDFNILNGIDKVCDQNCWEKRNICENQARSAVSDMRQRTRNGWKNHLFFPLWYLSSSCFLMFFLASTRCDGSLKVSGETVPFKPSSSNAYRVGNKWE